MRWPVRCRLVHAACGRSAGTSGGFASITNHMHRRTSRKGASGRARGALPAGVGRRSSETLNPEVPVCALPSFQSLADFSQQR